MFWKNKILVLSVTALALLSLFYWLSAKPMNIFGKIPPPQKAQKILVIVAHPDDEAIGAGGFIADAVSAGAEVKVVIVTNGDANIISSDIANKDILSHQKDFVNEGKLRMRESLKGLSLAGVSDNNVIFLSFPDRGLRSLLTTNLAKTKTSKYTGYSSSNYQGSYRVGVPYTGEKLTELLKEIVDSFSPDIIITHSPLDGYGDHKAVYDFVKKVSGNIKLYSFVVHFRGPEFPLPFVFRPSEKLSPPKSLADRCSWAIYPLSQNTENIKYKEIKEYKTQLKDPALYLLLRAFIRTNELFCVNP